jgi:hypothetical protein
MKRTPFRFITVWMLASLLNLCGNGLFAVLEYGHVMSAFSDPNFTYASPFQAEYDVWNFGYVTAKNIYEKSVPDPGPKLGQMTFHTTPELDMKIRHHENVLWILFCSWIVVVGFLSAVFVEAAIRLLRGAVSARVRS